MKNLPIYLLFLSMTFFYYSCSNEDLKEVLPEDSNEPTSNPDPDTDPELTDIPCDFDLNNVVANSTIVVNCILDLNEATVDLPQNVNFEFEGGIIINGTLNFSGGNIDGKILNSTLDLQGDVKLSDPVFGFIPSRWDIVQGKVNDQTATKNRDNIELLINMVKELGATKFKINAFDAYFKVDGPLNEGVPAKHAINLPSDFHLAMSSETHIRMQPNGHFRPTLLAIYDEKNVIMSGGYLHGERDEHNYQSGYVDSDGATGSTHEWVNTMIIQGGENITIDGVTFTDPAGDCLNITSIYHFFDPRHIRSKNITLKNNKFIRARRTNLVITNAEYVYIENNEFIDGGIDTENSKGIAPSSNFNIEPVRGKNPDTGELIEYERVSHIFIKNNKQIVNDKTANPRAGSFQLSHGNGPIIVENNEMINTGISFTTTDGVIIRNNTITGSGISAGDAENFDRTDVVYDNEVYGNTIKHVNGTALNVGGNGVIVRDNNIEGTIGIALGAGAVDSNTGVSNVTITNNTIKASNRGITSMNTIKNVTIQGNTIDMKQSATFALVLTNMWNQAGDANFILRDNTVTGKKSGTTSGAPPSLLGANSLELVENSLGDIQINGGENMTIRNNQIDSGIGNNGVLFYDNSPNSVISNNDISIYTSQTPLNIECVKVNGGVVLSGVDINSNSCLEK